jgi:hypothetical protein
VFLLILTTVSPTSCNLPCRRQGARVQARSRHGVPGWYVRDISVVVAAPSRHCRDSVVSEMVQCPLPVVHFVRSTAADYRDLTSPLLAALRAHCPLPLALTICLICRRHRTGQAAQRQRQAAHRRDPPDHAEAHARQRRGVPHPGNYYFLVD